VFAFDPITPFVYFLGGHQSLAFFTSAAAAAVTAAVAHLNMKRTHRATAIRELKAELKELRPALFQAAVAVNAKCAADPWAVLDSQRGDACAILAALQPVANSYSAPTVWHAVLSGSEFAILEVFLHNAKPLIAVLRSSHLTIDDETKPYNGDKAETGRAILRAFNIKLGAKRRARVS
jgi:hypothetical protein